MALAIVVVLYALQALYSTDLEHAVKTLGFFYVPFAVADRGCWSSCAGRGGCVLQVARR